MKRPDRRNLTTADILLLVGSVAVGFGIYQAAWRGLFHDWYTQTVRNWETGDWTLSGRSAVRYASDAVLPFIPLAGAWTVLLPVLRRRPGRPRWRRVWRQPGMAACLASGVGWAWALAGVLLSAGVCHALRPPPNRRPADLWAQTFFATECFMYVGLAVAATWAYLALSGRWRRSVDTIDRLGRFVGLLWIAIGLVWTLREYTEAP